MSRRWRPPLVLVTMGALGGTLAVSFLGLIALRYLGPAIGFRLAAVLLMTLIGLATLVLAWLFARLILGPVDALERFASAVGQHRDGVPQLTRFGTAELFRTGQSVQSMARTLRDREATVRAYTQHVTHELRTPVSAIRAATELLEDSELPAEDRRLLDDIDGARRQIEAQLDALNTAARARESRFAGISDLADVVDDLRAAHPRLTLDIEGGSATYPIGAEGLGIILHQLLRNAAEHGAQSVTLIAGTDDLLIRDDGPGVSDGHASRIFDPFFTSRRGEGGSGMGLTIARNVAEAHGATLTHAKGEPGATFMLRFGEGERQ